MCPHTQEVVSLFGLIDGWTANDKRLIRIHEQNGHSRFEGGCGRGLVHHQRLLVTQKVVTGIASVCIIIGSVGGIVLFILAVAIVMMTMSMTWSLVFVGTTWPSTGCDRTT